MALGAKFYLLDFVQQKLQEVPLSESALGFGMNEPVAVKAFDIGEEVLLCYSDAGIWMKGSSRSIMHWSSSAKAFARSGTFLFVFTTNYVEIWDWQQSKLMQAVRAPSIRPLNTFNSGLRSAHEKVDACLAAVTYLQQPNPHLCKLEVIV